MLHIICGPIGPNTEKSNGERKREKTQHKNSVHLYTHDYPTVKQSYRTIKLWG